MSQSGPGRREVAYRIFAAEFDDATLSYSESDEERAPNYVVTPTGARVNRLFAVGVLTEVEDVNPEMVRGRIVDPTGAFVTYAGQYQPDALAFLERADPPLFVALSGKARTYEPDDSDQIFSSVRPESVSEVDAETRDRWVVTAAERTIDRIGITAAAIESDLSGDELRKALSEAGVDERLAEGVSLALDHYGTTPAYLEALKRLCTDALRVVTGERDEVGRLELDPDERGGMGDPAALATIDLSGKGSATGTSPMTERSETPDTTKESGTSDSAPGAETTAGRDGTTTQKPEQNEPSTAETGNVEDPTDGADTEPSIESTAETGSTADPGDETAVTTETAGDTESTTAIDTDAESDIAPDVETATTAADETNETDEPLETDPEDFDPGEFELDEEERREVEEQYGTEFSTASEVEPADDDSLAPDAGTESSGDEPDLKTDSEDVSDVEAEPEPEQTAEPGSDTQSETESEVETEPEPATDEAPDEEIDLSDAVMETMKQLDGGDGADRDALIETIVDEHGADPDEIESEIQDALMSGRCYEPSDGNLKPI